MRVYQFKASIKKYLSEGVFWVLIVGRLSVRWTGNGHFAFLWSPSLNIRLNQDLFIVLRILNWVSFSLLLCLVQHMRDSGYCGKLQCATEIWNWPDVGNSAIHVSWNTTLQCPSIPTRNTKQRQRCQTRNWVTSLCKQEMCAILSTSADRQHSIYETS